MGSSVDITEGPDERIGAPHCVGIVGQRPCVLVEPAAATTGPIPFSVLAGNQSRGSLFVSLDDNSTVRIAARCLLTCHSRPGIHRLHAPNTAGKVGRTSSSLPQQG